MRPEHERIQRAAGFFVQALLTDPAVRTLIGDRVWDDIPNDPQHTYCSVGPHYFNPDDAEALRLRVHYFQFDCLSQQQGRRDEINDLIDAVKNVLHDNAGDLGTHALVFTEVVLVRVLDMPDGAKHGVIQVKAELEED